LVFVGEKRIGLYSEYMFNCAMCRKKEVIESEDPRTSLMDINTAAVTAAINSGQGFVQ